MNATTVHYQRQEPPEQTIESWLVEKIGKEFVERKHFNECHHCPLLEPPEPTIESWLVKKIVKEFI